jgi:hypothetical protein
VFQPEIKPFQDTLHIAYHFRKRLIEDTVKILIVFSLKKTDGRFQYGGEDRIKIITFTVPLLNIGIGYYLQKLAVGRRNGLSPVLLDDLNDILVQNIIIPGVEISENSNLGPLFFYDADTFKKPDDSSTVFSYQIFRKSPLKHGYRLPKTVSVVPEQLRRGDLAASA